ncbi:hypothetical protein [Arenimonas aestuarii]
MADYVVSYWPAMIAVGLIALAMFRPIAAPSRWRGVIVATITAVSGAVSFASALVSPEHDFLAGIDVLAVGIIAPSFAALVGVTLGSAPAPARLGGVLAMGLLAIGVIPLMLGLMLLLKECATGNCL